MTPCSFLIWFRKMEESLQENLTASKAQLDQLDEVLALDPENEALISLRADLSSAITLIEESLLDLKKVRLLSNYGDEAATVGVDEHDAAEDVRKLYEDIKTFKKPLQPNQLCRVFRNTYRGRPRWELVQIKSISEDQTEAVVTFRTPSKHSDLPCKHFLQDRCRYASSCQFSHGETFPTEQLIPFEYNASVLSFLQPHKICLALFAATGLWYPADILSVSTTPTSDAPPQQPQFTVKYCDYEGIHTLPLSSIFPLITSDRFEPDETVSEGLSTVRKRKRQSDDSAASSSSELDGELGGESGSDSSDEEAPSILRLFTVPTHVASTVLVSPEFGAWEAYTRGIGSKLLAKMGYIKGQGLGRHGKGIVTPVEAQILDPRKGLDFDENGDGERKKKKRRRGGKKGKQARARRRLQGDTENGNGQNDNENTQDTQNDLFSLINDNLFSGIKDTQIPAVRSAGLSSADSVQPLKKPLTTMEMMQSLKRKRSADPAPSPPSAVSTAAISSSSSSKSDAVAMRARLLTLQEALPAADKQVIAMKASVERNRKDKKMESHCKERLSTAENQAAAIRAEIARLQSKLHITKQDAKSKLF
eukprot:GILK01012352.1.p1 GENE.GILK01012352.1~~GILK01012352.1.p1  ORF type:complete len:591 (+),score=113.93 GILK01012352.1:138-1910(+)